MSGKRQAPYAVRQAVSIQWPPVLAHWHGTHSSGSWPVPHCGGVHADRWRDDATLTLVSGR